MNKEFVNYISPGTPLDEMDELERYALWVLNEVPLIGFVPFQNPFWSVENIVSLVVHRRPPFQTQLFMGPPGVIVPEHTHPNVDSIEVYVGGELRLSHSGKLIQPEEFICENPNSTFKTALLRGSCTRVRPNDIHGGFSGEKNGAVFLSIQHWLNGVEPSSVGTDWNGKVMGPNHLDKVAFGNAEISDKPFTKKDAAQLED
jgi:hypothetical protein